MNLTGFKDSPNKQVSLIWASIQQVAPIDTSLIIGYDLVVIITDEELHVYE